MPTYPPQCTRVVIMTTSGSRLTTVVCGAPGQSRTDIKGLRVPDSAIELRRRWYSLLDSNQHHALIWRWRGIGPLHFHCAKGAWCP
jgi:hypothetical protein